MPRLSVNLNKIALLTRSKWPLSAVIAYKSALRAVV